VFILKMPRWKTVEWAVVGRMNNNGQSCIAPKVLLPEAIADEFIQKFKDALSKLSRDPMDPATN
jgi:succinate-semialdehyde dehydrogenase/glutarate-semialdehyde dehydrogenase